MFVMQAEASPDVAGNLRWLHATEHFAVTGTLTMCAANIFQEGTVPEKRRSKETERQKYSDQGDRETRSSRAVSQTNPF